MKAKKIQVQYKCGNHNESGTGLVTEPGKKTVVCDYCGLRMFVDLQHLSLGANGHTEATLKHDLQQVRELD